MPVGVAVLIWLPLRVWEYEHECDCVCFLLTVSHRLSDSRALTKTLGCHGGNNQTPQPFPIPVSPALSFSSSLLLEGTAASEAALAVCCFDGGGGSNKTGSKGGQKRLM